MFFDQEHNQRPVLIDAVTGRSTSGAELYARASSVALSLKGLTDRSLLFLLCQNDERTIVSYVACLLAKMPVVLVDAASFTKLGAEMLAAYEPAILVGPARGIDGFSKVEGPEGVELWVSDTRLSARKSLHEDLAVLLTTSGSTGSPKCVRLSAANLEANAKSIASYLGLTADERAILSLPVHYSYGLSVLDSHLVAGASTVLTDASFMGQDFWKQFSEQKCTSFAGVPFMYETMARLRFEPRAHPTLRTLTQAGGNLLARFKVPLAVKMREAGGRFFAMYGQTEATARISYVPPERLEEKSDSIGVAIPGGALEVQPVEGVDAPHGELVYRGPNVMMGYAESAADLARGDDLQGVLRTGDLGWRDDDGYFFISGRLKRFAKCQGRRVNLDDVERKVEAQFSVSAAVIEHPKGIGVFFSGEADAMVVRGAVAEFLMIPPASIHCEGVSQLPRLANGKKDYKALRS